MRLFTATLATETNTFSPLPTSIENYRESVFFRAGEHPTDAPRMCTAPLFVGRARAKAEGFELIEGSCFAASPAGTTATRSQCRSSSARAPAETGSSARQPSHTRPRAASPTHWHFGRSVRRGHLGSGTAADA